MPTTATVTVEQRHEVIWLEPPCCENRDRCWSQDPLDDCDECGAKAVKYVRFDRERENAALREAITKVRDGYASQAKFADIDCAVHFREFVRRIDAALVPADPAKGET